MNYLIHQAIGSIKHEIQEYEKKLAKTKNEYERGKLETIISWLFERGLNLLRFAEDCEVSQELVDWYLDRLEPNADRPDIRKFKKRLRFRMRERGRLRSLPVSCPVCGGEVIEIPAGISRRTGRPYNTFWVCKDGCDFTCNKIRGGFECKYPKNAKFKEFKKKSGNPNWLQKIWEEIRWRLIR